MQFLETLDTVLRELIAQGYIVRNSYIDSIKNHYISSRNSIIADTCNGFLTEAGREEYTSRLEKSLLKEIEDEFSVQCF